MNKKIFTSIRVAIVLMVILMASSDINANIIKHNDVVENPPTTIRQIFRLLQLDYINKMSYMDSYHQVNYDTNDTHSWMDIRIDVEVYDLAYNITYINGQPVIEIDPQIHNYTLVPVFAIEGLVIDEYQDVFKISEYRLKYSHSDYADIEDGIVQFVNKVFDFTHRYIIDTSSPIIINEEKKTQRLNIYKLLIAYNTILIIMALIIIRWILIRYYRHN